MERKTLDIVLKDVVLRRFFIEDAQDMFDNYGNDPEVAKYVSWDVHGNVENTKAYLNTFLSKYDNEEYYHWAIVDKNTNQVIGAIGEVETNETSKQKELGWVISKAYWGKGITTLAAKAVIKFLFERGWEKLTAKFVSKNIGSGKVMQKIGMRFAGVGKLAPIKPSSQEEDTLVYFEITKKDYEKQTFFERAYQKFGDEWGFEAQIRMAVEECSELIKEIMKFIRFSKDAQPGNKEEKLAEITESLKQEVADALNCVEQVKFLLDADEIEEIRKQKIGRTFLRIENMKKESK